jgi:hypothetical protein
MHGTMNIKFRKHLYRVCIGIDINRPHEAGNGGIGCTHCFNNSYNNGPCPQRTATAKVPQHYHHPFCVRGPLKQS